MATEFGADLHSQGSLDRGESHVLELLATGAPLETVLDTLCRVIDEQSGLVSSIFLLDPPHERLTLAAGPHLPAVWREAVASFPTAPSVCGAAVTSRCRVVAPDVTVDPLFAGFLRAAEAAGIRAVWSTPFYASSNQALGTFAVYSGTPGPPTPENLLLVDRATHLASLAVENFHTVQSLRESELRFAKAFYVSPAAMAITRYGDGKFLYVNDSFVRMFGYSRAELIGQTALSLGLYLDPEQRPVLRQLASENKLRNLDLRWRTKSGELRDIVVSSARIELLGEDCLIGAGIDVTARKAAEERLARSLDEMRTVTGRLMRAQDDERRRIAQLMHETAAQELAALKMLLAELNRRLADAPAADRSLVAEMTELAERSIGGIRSLSYLLHPPLLDEIGLVSAIRWYADGFAQRSGMTIRLDLPVTFPRFPQDVETTLFRVVQEALINVHRHANSATGDIRLSADAQGLTLEVADQGNGISDEVLAHVRSGGAAGVGLAGMRQRLEQLGGTLDIASDTQGTAIRAQLPLPQEAV